MDLSKFKLKKIAEINGFFERTLETTTSFIFEDETEQKELEVKTVFEVNFETILEVKALENIDLLSFIEKYGVITLRII